MSGTPAASDSAPFWDGFEEKQVRLPFCTRCDRPHLPPGPMCPYCHNDTLEWRPATLTGRLSSWVVERKKWFAAFDPPYIVGEVELDDGPRMPVQVDMAELDRLRVDLRGHIEFSVAPNGRTLPKFLPGR